MENSHTSRETGLQFPNFYLSVRREAVRKIEHRWRKRRDGAEINNDSGPLPVAARKSSSVEREAQRLRKQTRERAAGESGFSACGCLSDAKAG